MGPWDSRILKFNLVCRKFSVGSVALLWARTRAWLQGSRSVGLLGFTVSGCEVVWVSGSFVFYCSD